MKKKNGRPSKKDKISLKTVETLAGYGLIDIQIANVLGICEATLNNYKKDPKFIKTLKRGKDKADKEVAKSLYQRATGYKHDELKLFCHNGRIISKTVVKHYAPDPVSMIFWLKNRQPAVWREVSEHKHSGLISHELFLKDIIKKSQGVYDRQGKEGIANRIPQSEEELN